MVAQVRAWLAADPRRGDVAVAVLTVVFGSLVILGGPDEEFDTGWPEVAAGVGAFVLVLFRRRWPFATLATAFLWSVTHVVVLERPAPIIFATMVLLSIVAAQVERREAIMLGIAVGVGLYIGALWTTNFQIGDARALIIVAWAGAAVGIGDARRSYRRSREASEAELRSAVLAAEARTQQQVTEERLTIARELHDLLAHNLSVMNVQTGAAMHLLRADPDGAEAALGVAREAGRSVLDELRELLSVLRHDESDDGAPTASLPTVDDIAALVETMRATGLAVEWHDRGAPRSVAPAVSLAAYRVVQEGLTNAAKHGDGAAELVTEWSDDALRLAIANAPAAEATAAAETGSGHGLVGMRERVVANGGSFDAGVRVGGRFSVDVELPVAPVAHPGAAGEEADQEAAR